MSKVILQPCGDAHAIQHYEETIAQPVTLDSIRHCLSDEEFDELSRVYPDGNTRIWGVTPGAKGVNARKWDRIHPGDVTLIARNGAIFASAVTTYKTHNLRLATHLWGDNGNGATWEYVYFVSEVKLSTYKFLPLDDLIAARSFVKSKFLLSTLSTSS